MGSNQERIPFLRIINLAQFWFLRAKVFVVKELKLLQYHKHFYVLVALGVIPQITFDDIFVKNSETVVVKER